MIGILIKVILKKVRIFFSIDNISGDNLCKLVQIKFFVFVFVFLKKNEKNDYHE